MALSDELFGGYPSLKEMHWSGYAAAGAGMVVSRRASLYGGLTGWSLSVIIRHQGHSIFTWPFYAG
jgi:hypothetical protein